MRRSVPSLPLSQGSSGLSHHCRLPLLGGQLPKWAPCPPEEERSLAKALCVPSSHLAPFCVIALQTELDSSVQ